MPLTLNPDQLAILSDKVMQKICVLSFEIREINAILASNEKCEKKGFI